jgi:hypothetical protein
MEDIMQPADLEDQQDSGGLAPLSAECTLGRDRTTKLLPPHDFDMPGRIV